jgi:hypothetical protein
MPSSSVSTGVSAEDVLAGGSSSLAAKSCDKWSRDAAGAAIGGVGNVGKAESARAAGRVGAAGWKTGGASETGAGGEKSGGSGWKVPPFRCALPCDSDNEGCRGESVCEGPATARDSVGSCESSRGEVGGLDVPSRVVRSGRSKMLCCRVLGPSSSSSSCFASNASSRRIRCSAASRFLRVSGVRTTRV